jgi:hypothetical protein
LDEIDLLQHALVLHFEVFRAKAGDGLAAIRDEHIHTNGFDTRGERRLLGTRREPGSEQQRQSKRNLH